MFQEALQFNLMLLSFIITNKILLKNQMALRLHSLGEAKFYAGHSWIRSLSMNPQMSTSSCSNVLSQVTAPLNFPLGVRNVHGGSFHSSSCI